MANLLTTNVVGQLNVTSGVIQANASPLTNTITQVQTGLSCFLVANIQTTSTMSSTNVLSVTFNEVGMYQVEGLLILASNTTATNTKNLTVGVAFANSGTFHYNVANMLIGYTGAVNSNIAFANVTSNANTQVKLANGNVAPTTNNFVSVSGILNVSATGTAQTQIACLGNTVNGNIILCSGSYVSYTKIG